MGNDSRTKWPRGGTLLAGHGLSAQDLVTRGAQDTVGILGQAETRREDVVDPRDVKGLIKDEKTGISVADDRRKLLALPLQHLKLTVKEAQSPLALPGIVLTVLSVSSLGCEGATLQGRSMRVVKALTRRGHQCGVWRRGVDGRGWRSSPRPFRPGQRSMGRKHPTRGCRCRSARRSPNPCGSK